MRMLNSWPLHNCTAEQQSGGGCVLATAKFDRLAEDFSGRIATELRRVLKSALRGHRASALTRHDTICQIPRKCLLERINTLKYSFILVICFHA